MDVTERQPRRQQSAQGSAFDTPPRISPMNQLRRGQSSQNPIDLTDNEPRATRIYLTNDGLTVAPETSSAIPTFWASHRSRPSQARGGRLPPSVQPTGVTTASFYYPDASMDFLARTGAFAGTSSRKRSATTAELALPSGSSPTTNKRHKTAEEKRLRSYRSRPRSSFNSLYATALTQRFNVLSRQRTGTDDCPEEIVELIEPTAKIYTIHISKLPKCNCPRAVKRGQCAHVLYVMKMVLHASYELTFQSALLSSELQDIFSKAPPISGAGNEEYDKRKPIDGECIICFSTLVADKAESIVWCHVGCGQNMHKKCFTKWAKTKPKNVTCPMCRSPWQKNTQIGIPRMSHVMGIFSTPGHADMVDQLGVGRGREHRLPEQESTVTDFLIGHRLPEHYRPRLFEMDLDYIFGSESVR